MLSIQTRKYLAYTNSPQFTTTIGIRIFVVKQDASVMQVAHADAKPSSLTPSCCHHQFMELESLGTTVLEDANRALMAIPTTTISQTH